MIFDYKGTEYEFPDDMPDDEALRLIRAEEGETDPVQPTVEPQPEPDRSFMQKAGDLAMQNIHGLVDPVVSSVKNAYESVTQADDKDVERMQQAGNAGGKVLAGTASIARDIGDVAAVPFTAFAGVANNAIPQGVKDYVKNDAGVQAIGKGVEYIAEKVKKAPGWVKDLIDIGLNVPIGGVVGKVGTKAATKTVAKAGNAVEGAGKKFYGADLKIRESVAKKGYGGSMVEKKQNILNTIFDEGLDKEKTFVAAKSKGDELINSLNDEAKSIIDQYSLVDNPQTVNPVDVMYRIGLKEIDNSTWGAKDKIANTLENIIKDASKDGFDKPMPLSGLVEAKKKVKRKKTFNNGPSPAIPDPDEELLRKKLYLGLLDEVSEISPELKLLGQREKKIFDAVDALDYGASRIANRNPISLTDQIIGTGGLASTMGGLASGSPETALYSLLTTGGILTGKKLLEQGRGASKIARAGKAIKKVASNDMLEKIKKRKGGSKSIDEILDGTPITDQKRQLPAPMIDGEIKYDPMLPSVGDRVRAVGKTDDYKYAKIKDNPVPIDPNQKLLLSPEDIQKQYPHLSKEDARKMAFRLNERKALPAPMVGESAQSVDPMLPTMGEKIKAIGTGEQNRFKMPETSSVPKREPLAVDIGTAAKEFTTLPQLKATTKRILQEVPLTAEDKDELVDFLRYINKIDDNAADWPSRVDKYTKRTSQKYALEPLGKAFSTYMEKHPNAKFNMVFNKLKEQGHDFDRASLYKMFKERK